MSRSHTVTLRYDSFGWLCVVLCVVCSNPLRNSQTFTQNTTTPPTIAHLIAHRIKFISLLPVPLLTLTTKRGREKHDICQVVNSAVEAAYFQQKQELFDSPSTNFCWLAPPDDRTPSQHLIQLASNLLPP